MDACPPLPTDTAVRAAPYDAAYWQARYVKVSRRGELWPTWHLTEIRVAQNGKRFEWYTQVGSEASLDELLQDVLSERARVLDLGCGTSQCVRCSPCSRRDDPQL